MGAGTGHQSLEFAGNVSKSGCWKTQPSLQGKLWIPKGERAFHGWWGRQRERNVEATEGHHELLHVGGKRMCVGGARLRNFGEEADRGEEMVEIQRGPMEEGVSRVTGSRGDFLL